MFFSSTFEFTLIASFITLFIGVSQLKRLAIKKLVLLLGNGIVLFTILSLPNILTHIIVGGIICLSTYFISKLTSKKTRGALTGIFISLLVSFFVYRNYGVEESFISRLGISYLLFRHIQFLVDGYNGKIRSYNVIDYINFTMFFPNFLAGPIDTYTNFSRWHNRPFGKLQRSLILPGVSRIFIGVIKKYGIVPLFIAEATNYSLLQDSYGIYLGLFFSLTLYSLYIFLDFSGYSDIAIGTGYLLGIRTPENFRSPYLSTNLADFWKRWHITFSVFLRSLIFKPVVTTLSSWFPAAPRLFISSIGYITTFVLCGVWHGNTWNFVLWGLWHGIGLVILKLWQTNRKAFSHLIDIESKSYEIGMVIFTFIFVTIGWSFFHYRIAELIEIWHRLL